MIQIQDLFRRVRAKSEERHADEFQAYWHNIVKPLAEGRELAPEAVVDAAEALGRSPDQVQQDVELYRSRKRMAEELALMPRWQADADKLQATIDQAAAELQNHEKRLREIINTAYAKKVLLETKINACITHERDLTVGNPNPSLASREKQLTERVLQLSEKRRSLLVEIDSQERGTTGWALKGVEQNLAEAKQVYARFPDSHSRIQYDSCLKQIEHYQQKIKELRGVLATIDEELDALNAERALIRKQKLTP